MTAPTMWTVEQLIPHRGEMILIDALQHYDDQSVTVSCTPKADGILTAEQSHMPAWVGIELMAQAIASYAGVSALRRGEQPKVGFLLGTRAYHAHVDRYPVDHTIQITATHLYMDDSGLGAFECRIFNTEQVLAEATVNVFEPKDFYAYLRGER